MAILAAGCVAPGPQRQEPDYRPTWAYDIPVATRQSGALYAANSGLSLFGDQRARQVGDVVTIILEERTRSSKKAETSLSKGVENRVLNPNILGNIVRSAGASGILNSVDSETKFAGEADSDQSNSLTGTISAVVAQVLPNGLMLVQGEKWLQLNRGEEYIRVSGLVRPEDVAGDNQVSSLRLADARIAYGGTGELADTNTANWLTRFFLGTVFPF